MGARKNVQYECNSCGAVTSSWSGKCMSCGEWNTLTEQLLVENMSQAIKHGQKLQATSLQKAEKIKNEPRVASTITEVDTVLGGGFVAGSVNLIAGQPGIGKSTLLLQIASAIGNNVPVLYVSGEESVHQVASRSDRLKTKGTYLEVASSSSADDIAITIASKKYKLVIVDSIQTISVEGVSSAAGSVSQITNSTHVLSLVAKSTNTALIIVGHVTKEGSIAGPKVLEHLVDVVLQIEGDRYGGFKVLRGVKNRYGSTNEVGIFEMVESGMQPVKNPSAALLAERQVSDGSIVLATMEGSRPLLVEVQALVNKSNYGYPKRAASGIDLNRVNLLIAMLERRTKLSLAEHDIYVNIVGGMKVTEPAADLAICMAIASASKGLSLRKMRLYLESSGSVARFVMYLTSKRVQEAIKLGFDGAIGPKIRTGKKPAKLSEVLDIRAALNGFLES